MPDFSSYTKPEDPNLFDRAMAVGAFDTDDARAAVREGAQITPYALDNLGAYFGPGWMAKRETLGVEDLNERYGLEGYLRFNADESAASAEVKARAAGRRAYRDKVLSSTPLSGMDAMWQSFVGGASDPIAIPTYFFGIGEVNAGRAGAGALVGMGRARLVQESAARGVLDNLIGGVAYEGLNWGLKSAADEDYDFGQAFDNLTVGSVLGAGIGGIAGNMKYSGAVKEWDGIKGVIAQAAQARGQDAATLIRIAELESGFDASAANPRSSARGLFQFMPGTWNAMGGGDRFDGALSAERGADLMVQNRRSMAQALGREPEPWELYLAHQQGAGGAAALLDNPDENIVALYRRLNIKNPEAAVTGNGGRVDMTAGEFAGLWREKFNKGFEGAVSVDAPVSPMPEPIRLLSPTERAGGFEQAMEDLYEGRLVNVAPLLPQARAYEAPAASGEPFSISIPARPYRTDVAITVQGTEIPVRYAIVDADTLITSHTDDMQERADYPQEYQERDRGRAGSIAYNRALEARLNPRLMTQERSAAAGAPVIGKDGVVLSGNGRTIALRRSAATGGDTYKRYVETLKDEGYDLSGIERPVLVRVNMADMSHGETIRWTRDANRDVVEGKGAVETAAVDAAKITPDMLSLLTGPDVASAGNRDFMRAFGRGVAPDALNRLTTESGEVSAEAVRRVNAALMHVAYDNPALIKRMFEDADSNIKSIGKALQEAAADFARLRGLIEAGRVAPEADVSADLNAALNLIMEARDAGRPIREVVQELIDQTDMITGDAMSEAQILMLRGMFKDADFKVARSADDMAATWRKFVASAEKVVGEVDILGNSALSQVQEVFEASYKGLDEALTLGTDRVFTFRNTAERTRSNAEEALGLGRTGGSDGPAAGSEAAARSGAGDGPAPATAERRINPQALIAADDELSAIAADLAVLEAGQDVKPKGLDNLDTVAEAMRAAAFCLIEGGADA